MMTFNRRQLRGQGERDVGNGGSSHSVHQDTSLAESNSITLDEMKRTSGMMAFNRRLTLLEDL